VVEDVGQPARERISAARPVPRVRPFGVVAERRLHALECEETDEILEPLLMQEPTPAGELIVRDLPSELQQAIAAETVRLKDLLGCAAHSSGVHRRRASGLQRLR
jgi:hypothetical protein